MALPNVVPGLLRGWTHLYPRILKRLVREHIRGWCSDDELEVTLKHGFKMYASPRDWASYSIYFFGVYDEPLTQFIQTRVFEGDTCWDIGSERGWFTLLMASLVGSSGRVDAFEAFPGTFAKLQANLVLNQLHWVNARNIAISEHSGEAFIVPPQFVKTRRFSNSGVGHLSTTAGPHGIRVPASSIDDYAAQVELERLDFIKLDIEGFEHAALLGAHETIRRFRPTMVVEYSPHALSRAGSSVAALDALLDDSGYDRFTFVDRLKRLRLEGYPGLEDEDTVFNVYCIPRSG